jgi:hypothetical protein
MKLVKSVGNGREHAFPELSPRLDRSNALTHTGKPRRKTPRLDRSNALTHRETEEEDDEQ